MRDVSRRQIVGALVLSAVCAELLAAYGDNTGSVAGIAFSVVFFAGLYGAPMLLAREVVRRRGWGWGSLLCIYLGLGIAQACLIDQSLFAVDYLGYAGWEEVREATFVPALGISAYNAFSFIGGHLIFSFGAPMALAESWRPNAAERPWLGRTGIVIAVLAYIATAGAIAADEDSHHATAAQFAAAAALVLVCFGAAVLIGRRHEAHPAGPATRMRTVFLVALPVAAAGELAPQNWAGLAGGLAALAVVAVIVGVAGAGAPHPAYLAAAGSAYLVVRGALAFTYYPLLGEVAAVPKYAHNVVMLLVVLAAAGIAYARRAEWSVADPDGLRGHVTQVERRTVVDGDGHRPEELA